MKPWDQLSYAKLTWESLRDSVILLRSAGYSPRYELRVCSLLEFTAYRLLNAAPWPCDAVVERPKAMITLVADLDVPHGHWRLSPGA